MTTSRTRFILLIAIAVFAICGTSNAQSLIGSSGAGWQTWSPDIALNNNHSPYWDSPWTNGNYNGSVAVTNNNSGFCMTSTGDCQGLGSALFAPGALPFWGMAYNAAADTGGARDNTVYFKANADTEVPVTGWGTSIMSELQATLYLNYSNSSLEINEFGWFETNSTGTIVGTRHMLFQGTGEPVGTLTPDPVGSTRTFRPTQYFGFYYSDVSEPACPDGTSNCNLSPNQYHGCYVYTLFNKTEPRCLEATGFQGDHDFVVFTSNPSSNHPTYWVVGEDPTDCANQDGDCNLTIVKVSQRRNHD